MSKYYRLPSFSEDDIKAVEEVVSTSYTNGKQVAEIDSSLLSRLLESYKYKSGLAANGKAIALDSAAKITKYVAKNVELRKLYEKQQRLYDELVARLIVEGRLDLIGVAVADGEVVAEEKVELVADPEEEDKENVCEG